MSIMSAMAVKHLLPWMNPAVFIAGIGGAGAVLGLTLQVPGIQASESELLAQRFVSQSELASLTPGAILPASGDVCPPGWSQVTADSEPLYFAFGMLVDATGAPDKDGRPYSSYTLLLACEKQP